MQYVGSWDGSVICYLLSIHLYTTVTGQNQILSALYRHYTKTLAVDLKVCLILRF